MPTASSILTPINIHGFGRSGTTLVQNILGQNRFIQTCNETIGLIFACYRGGELLLGSHDKEAPGLPGEGGAGSAAVHAALLRLLPSSKPAWCQKIGGIPNMVVWELLVTDDDRDYCDKPYPFPYGWYWRVLRSTFPFSKDILVLRAWRDVVMSRASFSGYAPNHVARDLAVYLSLMAHPAARIDTCVTLPHLLADPTATIGGLCGEIGIGFDTSCLRALDWHAAPGARQLTNNAATSSAWRACFNSLPAVQRREISDIIAPALSRFQTRFGDLLPE